jgi:hypothetical protein
VAYDACDPQRQTPGRLRADSPAAGLRASDYGIPLSVPGWLRNYRLRLFSAPIWIDAAGRLAVEPYRRKHEASQARPMDNGETLSGA